MNWEIVERVAGLIEGTTMPRVRFFLTGEQGIEIEVIERRDDWKFIYKTSDLHFEFNASKELDLSRGLAAAAQEDLKTLGPRCRVYYSQKGFSRGVNGNEARQIALNIREALQNHHKVPGARPPPVEDVVFRPGILNPQ